MFGFSNEESRLRGARRKVVERFRKGLPVSAGFEISNESDGRFRCASPNCGFEFAFERFESDQYVSFVYDPLKPDEKMHLYLFRLMFGAKGDGRTGPEATAAAITRHFPLLLDGEFSIFETYRRLEPEVLDGLEAAGRLPESSPIRRKIAGFDPSFLLDLRRTRSR